MKPAPACGALAAALVLAVGSPRASGAEAVPEALGPLFHPDGPGRLRLRLAAGAQVDVFPRRVAESEQRQFPQLTFDARLGLPAGFSVDAKIAAIYVTNQAMLGVAWSHRVKSVSLGLQNHAGFWFGFLGTEGFDSTAWGVLDQPGLSIGVAIGGHRLSLSPEALVMLSQHTTLGNVSRVSRTRASFAGIVTTLVVESPVGARGLLYYGVGLVWAQADYQAWIAFSDSRARLFYPRFLAGYAF